MKSAYKYVAGLVFTGLLLMVLNNTAAAQHRGGGGGGGFHGGGGGSFHGGGGFHGGSSFHGGGSGFHGSAGVRPGANSYRGNVSVRGGSNFRSQSFRGGVNYSHRGYVGARAGYGGRNYGGGFYRGGRYYGGRGYYGGHYGYGSGFRFGLGFGYPHIGFYLGYLPFGYYPFSYGDYQYYYSDGAFYRPYNGGYQVVTPPVGASVPSLPGNAQSITIDGQPYFEASGVYYQEAQDDNGKTIYVVAGKDGVLNTDNGNIGDQPRTDRDDPIMDNNNTSANNNYSQPDNGATTTVDIREGDIIKDLPADCRKVTLNDKKYYVSPDNIFYEDFKDTNGTKAYRVASVPKQ